MNATGRERQTDANHLVRGSDDVNGNGSNRPSAEGGEIGTAESDESGAREGGDRTRKLHTSNGRTGCSTFVAYMGGQMLFVWGGGTLATM